MVQPAIKKAKADNQRCRYALQRLFKIGVILTIKLQGRYIVRNTANRIHITKHQRRTQAGCMRSIQPPIDSNQRPVRINPAHHIRIKVGRRANQ